MKPAYPTFPASCWWPLRERFKRALPTAITADYLQSVLEVEPKTARNLVPMLRQMGMVDVNGAISQRANLWRVDAEYREICHAIRSELYPASLRDAVPEPSHDFESAVRWFMKSTGVGTAAARRMARFYSLLSKADPANHRERGAPGERISRRSRQQIATGEPSQRMSRESSTVSPSQADEEATPGGATPVTASFAPMAASLAPMTASHAPVTASSAQDRDETPVGGIGSIEFGAVASGSRDTPLVIQIHLPPTATMEQIDQLIASVARHLAPLARRG